MSLDFFFQMSTFLFDRTIFGPVKSRRLGNSLGINLLPNDKKICNFNCIYCECGWNSTDTSNINLPTISQLAQQLTEALIQFRQKNIAIDTITFAGNGEPTMHPQFSEIIDKVLQIRNNYYPEAKVAVLSNATLIFKKNIFQSLLKVDFNILKLDSAIEQTCRILNQPQGYFSISNTISNLKQFKGQCIIQTMFVKGRINNVMIDNTTNEEITAWLAALAEIKPKQVMIYTIARDTPIDTLQKVSLSMLKKIASQVELLNIPVSISD